MLPVRRHLISPRTQNPNAVQDDEALPAESFTPWLANADSMHLDAAALISTRQALHALLRTAPMPP